MLLSKLSKHLSGCLDDHAKNPSKEDNSIQVVSLSEMGLISVLSGSAKKPNFNYPPGSQPTSLILQNFHKQQVK